MTGSKPLLVGREWEASAIDWSEVLGTVPLFSELRKRQLDRIARSGRVAVFGRGETVVVKGEPGDSFYVVLGGSAEILGQPRRHRLGVGDHFGEAALLAGEPRSATVVATEELHVMRLPGRVFLDLVQENPSVALTIAKAIGWHLRYADRPLPSPS